MSNQENKKFTVEEKEKQVMEAQDVINRNHELLRQKIPGIQLALPEWNCEFSKACIFVIGSKFDSFEIEGFPVHWASVGSSSEDRVFSEVVEENKITEKEIVPIQENQSDWKRIEGNGLISEDVEMQIKSVLDNELLCKPNPTPEEMEEMKKFLQDKFQEQGLKVGINITILDENTGELSEETIQDMIKTAEEENPVENESEEGEES